MVSCNSRHSTNSKNNFSLAPDFLVENVKKSILKYLKTSYESTDSSPEKKLWERPYVIVYILKKLSKMEEYQGINIYNLCMLKKMMSDSDFLSELGLSESKE